MTKSKSPTEWLNPILDDFFAASTGIEPKGIPEHARRNAHSAILNHVEELVNEVIGSDDTTNGIWIPTEDVPQVKLVVKYRNKLRAIQRTQAKQLIRGKD